jgi:hypothetical protein
VDVENDESWFLRKFSFEPTRKFSFESDGEKKEAKLQDHLGIVGRQKIIGWHQKIIDWQKVSVEYSRNFNKS